MVESGIFYGTFIDPILKPMRRRVADFINPGESVLDVACGTGAQIFELAGKVSKATGVDLSESMIKKALKSKKGNTYFFVGDATNLEKFSKKEFNVAMMSLALHQFSPEMYAPILEEMKRISKRIIILDYAVPLPKNYVGRGSRWAEFMAGREHYRNFRKFYKNGGLNSILAENGLTIEKSVFIAKNAFQIVICSENSQQIRT